MILQLLRAKQWYKNLVIFLQVIFAGALFTKGHLETILFGFLSLCFASSASYIINDIVDAKEDKWHPEKSKRPIASGMISPGVALMVAIMIFLGSIAIAMKASYDFALCVLLLFILTQIYIFFLKKELFADAAMISTNFVIRAVSGAVLLSLRVSPWLILCTFFLSMFLVSAKRKGDLGLVRNRYTPEITDRMITFSTIALVMSYSLYSFLSIHPLLIATIPFAIYVIFTYSYLTDKDKALARNPERAFNNLRLTLRSILSKHRIRNHDDVPILHLHLRLDEVYLDNLPLYRLDLYPVARLEHPLLMQEEPSHNIRYEILERQYHENCYQHEYHRQQYLHYPSRQTKLRKRPNNTYQVYSVLYQL